METTKRNGIIVAGTLTLDITPVFESKKKAKSVDEVFVPGKVVHMEGMDIHPGGAVTNTGLGLKVLGAKVRTVGKVGKDVLGDIIVKFYDQYGAAGDLIVDPEISTSISIALTPPGIDRMFLHDPCAGNTFRKEDVAPALYETNKRRSGLHCHAGGGKGGRNRNLRGYVCGRSGV